MKIAMAQIATEPGDIEGNVAKMKKYIDQAYEQECDIVIFPELTIPGYIPMDLLLNDQFITDNVAAATRIRAYVESKPGMLVVFGYVGRYDPSWGDEVDPPVERTLYNSLVATYKPKEKKDGIVWDHFGKDKEALPEYDIFYEKRYFEPKRKSRVPERFFLEFKGKKIAFFICEDLWVLSPAKKIQEDLWASQQSIDLAISINASPYTTNEKVGDRYLVVRKTSEILNCPVVYVNQVGSMDGYDGEIVFDGHSMVVDAKSNPKIKHMASGFYEGLSICPDFLDGEISEHYKGTMNDYVSWVLLKDNKIPLMHDALIMGMRGYAERHGFKKFLVSLSGGIDSAVVLALAAEAFGADNVKAVTLPSEITSEGTLKDSYELAANLGVSISTVPISEIVDTMKESLEDGVFQFESREPLVSKLTLENIQARIRGNIIMAISNEKGHLVLSTGNKTELALGYCTLYGDMAGGLAVIGDVNKQNVFELAREINKRRDEEVIPQTIIDRPPSAELSEGQTDEEAIGAPYSVLSPLVDAIVEGATKRDIRSMFVYEPDVDNELIDKIFRLVKIAEYKRRQAPPAIKVSSKAFGIGRRMPTTYKFDG